MHMYDSYVRLRCFEQTVLVGKVFCREEKKAEVCVCTTSVDGKPQLR